LTDSNRIILTDCDGVLLDWEKAFDQYMLDLGHAKISDGDRQYSIGRRYGIGQDHGRDLIRRFNESARIGWLEPLRDAQHYIALLALQGWRLHCITSLTLDWHAQQLRRWNLQRLFGPDVIEHYVFLDTGQDKNQALAQYQGRSLLWIEDKIENCEVGRDLGLCALLMDHEHNREPLGPDILRVRHWQDVYQRIQAL